MEIWAMAGIGLGIALVGVFIGSVRDKARGTGYYSRYGPNSTREVRARVDKAQDLARDAAGWYLRGGKQNAIDAWQEASDLANDPDARACLGIARHDEGDLKSAMTHWRLASNRGHWASAVFLALAPPFEEPSPSLPRATSAFMRAFGSPHIAQWEIQNAKDQLIRIAEQSGPPGAAEALRERVDALDFDKLNQDRRARGR